MIHSKLLLAGCALFVNVGSSLAEPKIYQANRDQLLIIYMVDEVIHSVQQYNNDPPADKATDAFIENTILFHIWLMYLGPWRFDLHSNPEAERYLKGLPDGFSKIALTSPGSKDPLQVLPDLAKGIPIERCLPPIGRVFNLDTKAIRTKKDYMDMANSYYAWLLKGKH